MRTTLDLPEEIINEGLKVTHIKTKTELIITAVKELIRKHKINSIKEFRGKINLDIDINTLRGRS